MYIFFSSIGSKIRVNYETNFYSNHTLPIVKKNNPLKASISVHLRQEGVKYISVDVNELKGIKRAIRQTDTE